MDSNGKNDETLSRMDGQLIYKEMVISEEKQGWLNEYLKNDLDKMRHEIFRRVLFVDRGKHDKRALMNIDDRKWALIRIGKTEFLLWVDNKTMKAYKANGHDKTWIEIKYFKFIRWATVYDLW